MSGTEFERIVFGFAPFKRFAIDKSFKIHDDGIAVSGGVFFDDQRGIIVNEVLDGVFDFMIGDHHFFFLGVQSFVFSERNFRGEDERELQFEFEVAQFGDVDDGAGKGAKVFFGDDLAVCILQQGINRAVKDLTLVDFGFDHVGGSFTLAKTFDFDVGG